MQFGHPIADFEITQRKLARTASDIYAADAMLGVLASLADRGDGEYALEAACCKVFASEMLWRAADEMVQLAGGRGFVKPYPYERMLRDSRINRIFEGTNEILRLFIALNGIQAPAEALKEIGSALRRPLRNLGLLGGYAASRVKLRLGATSTLDIDAARAAARSTRSTSRSTSPSSAAPPTARSSATARRSSTGSWCWSGWRTWRSSCSRRRACIARTQSLIDERGVEACEREIALCDLFCVEAGRRFRASRKMLDGRGDEVDDTRRSVAASVRDGKGYFVTDAILDE